LKAAVFLQPAEEEMVEAARFYERRHAGLGFDFLAEIERAIARMREYPEAGRPVRAGTRRRLLRRFPYGLLYRADAEEIVIVAVMHLRRRPDYWRTRR
jgi:plasmid stabilization system protein ParE